MKRYLHFLLYARQTDYCIAHRWSEVSLTVTRRPVGPSVFSISDIRAHPTTPHRSYTNLFPNSVGGWP
jgi:hypothetical protein